MNKTKDYSIRQFLGDFWFILKGRRIKLCFFMILRFISDFSLLVSAFLFGKFVDFLTNYPALDFIYFWYYISAMVFIILFATGVRHFAKYNLNLLQYSLSKDLRVNTYSLLLDLDLKWHEKENLGNKLQRINNGISGVEKFLSFLRGSGSGIITNSLSVLIFFAVTNIKFFLFCLIFVVLYFTQEYIISKRYFFWARKRAKLSEKISGKIYDTSSNILTIKSLGLHSNIQKKNKRLEDTRLKYSTKIQFWSTTKWIVISLMGGLGYIFFLGVAAYDALSGLITIGTAIVYAKYFDKLANAVMTITKEFKNLIDSYVNLSRFSPYLKLESAIPESISAKNIQGNWKMINFKAVNFRYKNKNVLQNVNFTIKRGEKVGVVGYSGGGKSTLAKLMLRLYDPQNGSITFDKLPLTKIKRKSLHEATSVVLQESEMFNVSLQENIMISSSKKDLKLLQKIVKTAGLQDLITKLPLGLNTLLGEKGYKVSGGERQRIGLARALYKCAPLLILDEATSSLDSATEVNIQNALEKNFKDTTMIIIAHRLSTLRNVDKILVFDKGKIIEQGKFDDLIKQNGLFSKLYKLQNRR